MKRILSLSLAGFISLGPVLNTFAAGNIDLVAGSDRIQTSITTALKDGSRIDYVVLANAYSFADSLSSVNILNSHPNTKLILIGVNVNIKMYKKWKIKMYNLGSTIHQLSYHQ